MEFYTLCLFNIYGNMFLETLDMTGVTALTGMISLDVSHPSEVYIHQIVNSQFNLGVR